MLKHNDGLRPISIGLLLILAVLLLTSCDKAEEPVVLESEEIVVTPEDTGDDTKYTEDGRKLPTLKKKYQ
jgi:hypothetical protein